MLLSVTALALGFGLDYVFGDPHWMPHPVRLIGWLIARLERLLRGNGKHADRTLVWLGAVEAVVMLLVCAVVPLGLLLVAQWVSPWLRLALETLMCYQILATRALRDESMKVCAALRTGTLEQARQAVSMIVGRDTACLSAEQVAKAAVETVAENASDGVIAPLLFLAVGGAPLGFLYKAVNTMDSMLGYKNDRYYYFGRVPAKLDDLFNWIPARLSALLMIMAAWLVRLDVAGGWRVWQRDRRNHASPNSAQTESVCAGALGVELAGDAVYFGKVHHKPTIGDPLRPVTPEDIPAACRLLYGTAWLGLAVFGGLKLAIALLCR